MKRNWIVTAAVCLAVLLIASLATGYWENPQREEKLKVGFIYSEDESTPEVIDSQDESTADADASSKADTSSKATSDSSTKNPGTGAAAAMGILAVAAAGVAVSKKKSK